MTTNAATAQRRIWQIANAALYEGYLLYPYRHSALKNRQRWNFGVVYPREYSEAQGGGAPWTMRAKCLIEAPPATEAGPRRVIDLSLLEDDERVVPGDWVMAHAGLALSAISEQEALETLALLQEMSDVFLGDAAPSD